MLESVDITSETKSKKETICDPIFHGEQAFITSIFYSGRGSYLVMSMLCHDWSQDPRPWTSSLHMATNVHKEGQARLHVHVILENTPLNLGRSKAPSSCKQTHVLLAVPITSEKTANLY